MTEFTNIYRGNDPDEHRLLRLCHAMSNTLAEHSEFNGEHAVIMLDNKQEQRGGFMVYGYEDPDGDIDDYEVINDLLRQAKLIARGHGYDLQVNLISLS
jgi:hypothetical protein